MVAWQLKGAQRSALPLPFDFFIHAQLFSFEKPHQEWTVVDYAISVMVNLVPG